MRVRLHSGLILLDHISLLCEDCGCDTSLQKGQTALMCAAANGHAVCVRLLLDAGANSQAGVRVRFISELSSCSLLF
jgi:ankyrin repeat protein